MDGDEPKFVYGSSYSTKLIHWNIEAWSMNINQCMVVMKLVMNSKSFGSQLWPKVYDISNETLPISQSLSQLSNKCTDETTKQTEWDKCADLNKTYKTKAGLKKLQAGVNLLINLILCFTKACKNNRCMGFLHTSNKAQILYKSLLGSLVINFSPGVKKVKTSYMTIQKTL